MKKKIGNEIEVIWKTNKKRKLNCVFKTFETFHKSIIDKNNQTNI